MRKRMVYERLLKILEHWEATNIEFAEDDDEIIPGITIDDLVELKIIVQMEIDRG